MELTIFEQIFEQVNKANKVLVALPQTLTADSVASGLALALFLKRLNKEVTVAASGQLSKTFEFLPEAASIQPALTAGNSFVISLDTKTAPLDELSYESAGDKLNIFLKPKTGQYTPADVSFSQDQSPFQVAIVLDAASLENLGELFEKHADTFFNTPKINIDNKPSNEYFGAINFVDINASSIAEMLSDLFSTYEQQLVDEDIATCLLAGIITKTNSFQHVQTTPKAFLKASELVGLGGRQQEVVKHFYKTKPLPLLRLWGRALARLKMTDHALYSLLSKSDFEKSEANEEDTVAVLRELADNTSQYRLLALLYEHQNDVRLLLAAHPQISATQLTTSLNVPVNQINQTLGSMQLYETTLPLTTLPTAEQKLLQMINGL